ncbi:hypothetical protein ACO0K0_03690 [Undibacterium sp. SXout11W]|uniref:hypothetical protein n=1 Tax=Undibacterium sp. SXout11W TaxID=3413050 RepID=UPI003BF13970
MTPQFASKVDLFFFLSTLAIFILFSILISQHIKINTLISKLQQLPDQSDIDELKMSILEHKFQTIADFDELHRTIRYFDATNDSK